MTSISIRLSAQDGDKLAQLLIATQSKSQSDLIRKLINDQWVAMQAGRTFVERRGGHPENLLRGNPNDSERSRRKSEVGKLISERATKRRQK